MITEKRWWHIIGLAIAGMATALIVFQPIVTSASGMACGDRTSVLKTLSDKYKEAPRGVGLSTSGNIMFEVYTSEKGTWTILMTTKTGITCIMAAGHSWEDVLEIGEPT